MKLSKEMKKLLAMMQGKTAAVGPSSTGFSIRTFWALEKRGLVTKIKSRTFMINCAGNSVKL